MAWCSLLGARLVSIDSQEEYDFLKEKIEDFHLGLEVWWTGGRRAEEDNGEWKWFWDNGLNMDNGNLDEY